MAVTVRNSEPPVFQCAPFLALLQPPKGPKKVLMPNLGSLVTFGVFRKIGEKRPFFGGVRFQGILFYLGYKWAPLFWEVPI